MANGLVQPGSVSFFGGGCSRQGDDAPSGDAFRAWPDLELCSDDGFATKFRGQAASLGFDGFGELAVPATAGAAGAGGAISGAAVLFGVDCCSRHSLRHRLFAGLSS